MIITDFLSEISDVVFPPLCIGCSHVLRHEEEKVFCKTCRKDIHYLTGSHCPVCGTLFPDSPAGNHLCGSCLEESPRYTIARAALMYDGIVLDAIHQFKYSQNLAFGQALAKIFAGFDFPDIDWHRYDVIVPVPLHIRRLRSRGFNQSLILARALGERHKIRVDFSLLKRRKFTLTQTGLNKKERELNIKGVFEVTCPQKAKAKNILLIDDVFTTGATINECAKTLKKSGAACVAALTLARVL